MNRKAPSDEDRQGDLHESKFSEHEPMERFYDEENDCYWILLSDNLPGLGLFENDALVCYKENAPSPMSLIVFTTVSDRTTLLVGRFIKRDGDYITFEQGTGRLHAAMPKTITIVAKVCFDLRLNKSRKERIRVPFDLK